MVVLRGLPGGGHLVIDWSPHSLSWPEPKDKATTTGPNQGPFGPWTLLEGHRAKEAGPGAAFKLRLNTGAGNSHTPRKLVEASATSLSLLERGPLVSLKVKFGVM